MNKPFYGAASLAQSERPQIVNQQNVPGPGSYDANKEKGHNDLPKWSLKKRLDQGSCFQNLSSTPGPGRYQSQEGFKKQKELIISKKGEKYRHFYDKSYGHSPINLPGAINLKTGYSFGYRQAPKEIEKSPGPIYHLDSIVEKSRILKDQSNLNGFGSDKKNVVRGTCSPGPGAFAIQDKDAWTNKTCQNWTFGNGKRAESMPSTDLGPGQYSPKLNSSYGRTFKLRGRNEVKPYEPSALGPGAYNIPEPKNKIGGKINRPKEVDSEDEQEERADTNEKNLSPCSYNPPRYLEEPTNSGYSLGMKIEENLGSKPEEPGPGTYQVAGKYQKGNGGYMGRKVELKKKENLSMDNFNRYDPNLNTVARESPKFSFPQSSKLSKENRFTSSSQEFYQNVESKPSGYHFSMGTSKRFAELKKETGPFQDRQTDFSTIGLLPSYLKKTGKKK